MRIGGKLGKKGASERHFLAPVHRVRFQWLLALNFLFLAWTLLAPSFGLEATVVALVNQGAILIASFTAVAWMVSTLRYLVTDNMVAERLQVRGRSILSTALVMSALCAYFLGHVWQFIELLGGKNPVFPSWAHAFFLTFYPLAVAGFSLLPGNSLLKSDRVRLALDSWVLALTAGAIIWFVHLGPAVAQRTTGALGDWIRAAFPIGNLLLVVSLLVISARPFHASQWQARAGLFLSMGIWSALDVINFQLATTGGSYEGLEVIRAGRTLAVTLLALSMSAFAMATEGAEEVPRMKMVLWKALVPYLLLPVVIGLVAMVVIRGESGPVAWGVYGAAGILACLIFWRQLISITQTSSLNEQLNGVLESLSAKNQEVQKYATQVAEQYRTLAKMQVDLEESHKNLASTHRALAEQHDATQLQATQLKATNDELSKTRDKLQDSYHRLSQKQHETEKYTERLEIVNRELKQTQEEVQENLKRQEALNTELRMAKSELVEANDALADLNELLLKRASTDNMTQLPNHGAFQDRLREELLSFTRTGRPLSLILLDVDYFKHYNDAYGHQAGDQCLKMVARILEAQVRASDLVARYGGEEFAVLLPNTDIEGASWMAERIRSEVEANEFPNRWVTLSLGISSTQNVIPDPSLLVGAADEALYRAKQQGRNRWIVYELLNKGQQAA